MADSKQTKDAGRDNPLLQVLTKHYQALVSARSDQALLKDFAALLKFLRHLKPEESDRIFSKAVTRAPSKSSNSQPQYSDSDLANCSVEQLEKLINDESTPRKLLERVAIHRFNVPAGSMRSFSNRRMLVEKLATLIHNEQAHATIDSVARG